ncbi:MAG: PAS domain-containing protein [Candidatus Lokiarchaeota archaeon]|nr:PAS domain-containing protein [Candidatus Lokiarchaeota archaeon]
MIKDKRFKELIDKISTPVHIWRKINGDFVFEYFNEANDKLAKGKLELSLGKKASIVLKKDPDILALLNTCVKTKKKFQRTKEYQYKGSGVKKYLRSTYKFVEPDLVLIESEDITKEYEAKEQLVQSEAEYRTLSDEMDTIFDLIPVLIFYKDTDNNIIRGNKYLAEVLGLNKNKLRNVNCFDIFPKEDALQYFEDDKKIIRTRKPRINYEECLESKVGTRWVLTSKIPYIDDNNEVQGIIGVSIDITKRKQIELNLRKARTKLKELNLELEQKIKERTEELRSSEEKYREAYLLSTFLKDLLAHDMGNILQNIHSSFQLLNLNSENGDKLFKKYDEVNPIIKEQLYRARMLIDNVAKLSVLDKSDFTITSICFSIPLEETIDFMEHSFQDRAINIEINRYDKSLEVKANDFLRDVFENILFNAVKHNLNENVEISINVSTITKKGKDYAKFEFADNGVGITEERKKTLFQKGTLYNKKIKGMGIGLSLVKNIIDLYEGEILVEDRIHGDYSQGSVFIFKIPMSN